MVIVIDCVYQKPHFGVFNKLSVRDIKAIWDIVCVYKVQIVEGHLQAVSECRSVLPPIACPVILSPHMYADRYCNDRGVLVGDITAYEQRRVVVICWLNAYATSDPADSFNTAANKRLSFRREAKHYKRNEKEQSFHNLMILRTVSCLSDFTLTK